MDIYGTAKEDPTINVAKLNEASSWPTERNAMPDTQTVWSAVLTIVNLIVGGAVILLRDSLRELAASDKDLAIKVQGIELLVAGNYVRKDDFNRSMDKIFYKLDAIDEKLDTKMSRVDCPMLHNSNVIQSGKGMP